MLLRRGSEETYLEAVRISERVHTRAGNGNLSEKDREREFSHAPPTGRFIHTELKLLKEAEKKKQTDSDSETSQC